MRKIQLILIASFCVRSLCGAALAADPSETKPTWTELMRSEMITGAPLDLLRVDDALRSPEAFASGGDLLQQFIKFIFPISGREQRTMFLAEGYWGMKKPQYKLFDWRRFETEHFVFYGYPEGDSMLTSVTSFLEEDYDRNNRIFGVQNRFTKKIPVIFYMSRRDFEQSTVIEGTIPEGLGGLTELFAWKRATFPFEGERATFEHVAKHEGTHIYQIAKGSRHLPLWFIEGSAETNSVKWDAQAELTVRDAYLNGFFFHIDDLWQIQGTWLMYKIGNFISNLIWDEYGEQGFRKIFDRANDLSFDDNLKESLGITVDELDRKVFSALAKKYGALIGQKDLQDRSKLLAEEKTLLNARGRYFLSGGYSGSRQAIFLNFIEPDGKLRKKKVVEDRRYRNESLNYFQKGAFLDDHRLVYAIRRSKQDVIRVVPYRYDEEKRRFELQEALEIQIDGIDTLDHPVLVSDHSVAFIGYEKGFADLYLYDWQGKTLARITQDLRHLSDLDYSAARNELVFSREDEPSEKRADYDRNLYSYSFTTKKLEKLTDTPRIHETQPRISPDGKRMLFVSDANGSFDLFLYDFLTKRTEPLTRMRVGAKSPQWSGGENMMFTGYEKTSPKIYMVGLPDVRERLDLSRPVTNGQLIALKNDQLVLDADPPTQNEQQPIEVFPGLAIQDRQLVFLRETLPYTAEKAAVFDDHVVFRGRSGNPKDKTARPESRQIYFDLKKNVISELGSKVFARSCENQSLLERIKQGASGRAVVTCWVDSTEKKAFVVLNSRLALKEKSFKKAPDTTIGIVDPSGNLLYEADDFPHRDFTEQIRWVVFLPDGRVFLATASDVRGPFALSVYAPKENRFDEIELQADQFRISSDGARLLYRRMKTIWLADLKVAGARQSLDDLPSWSGEGVAMEFLENGNAMVFTAGKRQWFYSRFDRAEPPIQSRVIQHEPKEEVKTAAIDPITGSLVLIIRKKESRIWRERLVVYAEEKEALTVESGARYSRPVFRRGILSWNEDPVVPDPAKERAWDGVKIVDFEALKSVESAGSSGVSIETDRSFSLYDPIQGRGIPLGGVISGYSMTSHEILFSETIEDHFQIFSFDREKKEKRRWLSSEDQDVDPMASDHGMVIWSRKRSGDWTLEVLKTDTPVSQLSIAKTGFDLLSPKVDEGQVRATAYSKPKDVPFEPRLEEKSPYPRLLLQEPAPTQFRLQRLALAAAYDGDAFRYFISGFADNLFSDRGLFVDSIFIGTNQFASAGYTNLSTGNSVSLFFNSRDDIRNSGINFSKNFTLDRYREFDLYGQFETQDYGLANSNTVNFVAPDVENRRFYITKIGAVYAYDVAVWDYHGPSSGSRFFFKTETGVDTGNGRLSNVDANVDFRVYNRILPRFGFAHRIVAGTSQGDLPSVFLLGGNLSFRGVGFDDLKGQNYWVFSEDVRVPVFDIIGAKFFDPLDAFLGFFTRYFDVRGGIYTDVGEVWFNHDARDVVYSVGYFVNVPTMFGFQFRLNQGFAGKTGIGIWLGFNW